MMVNSYDEMQGSLTDVASMHSEIPDATDSRWAFVHGAGAEPGQLSNIASMGKMPGKKKGKKKHG